MLLLSIKRAFTYSPPTVCVTCAGADGGTPSNEKKAEAEKTLENAQTPQRRVHALLGAVTQ